MAPVELSTSTLCSKRAVALLLCVANVACNDTNAQPRRSPDAAAQEGGAESASDSTASPTTDNRSTGAATATSADRSATLDASLATELAPTSKGDGSSVASTTHDAATTPEDASTSVDTGARDAATTPEDANTSVDTGTPDAATTPTLDASNACIIDAGDAPCTTCPDGLADCVGDDACETDLQSTQSCGEDCADIAACDVLSSGICVNAGCSHSWAAWPVPNIGPDSYTPDPYGTVLDDITGLVWQQATAPMQLVQGNAAAYCQDLALGEHADWRLPTRIELLSLVDVRRSSPAIDTTAFPDTRSGRYWTASRYAEASFDAWSIDFVTGGAVPMAAGEGMYVRCVR